MATIEDKIIEQLSTRPETPQTLLIRIGCDSRQIIEAIRTLSEAGTVEAFEEAGLKKVRLKRKATQ